MTSGGFRYSGGVKVVRWRCVTYPGGGRVWCSGFNGGPRGPRPEAPENTPRPPEPPAAPVAFGRELPVGALVFIVTSAQNATARHGEFWETLEGIARHRNAELLVVPLRYKNPTSVFTDKQESDEWWDADVTPYLWNRRLDLGPNLVLLGDWKIQPTASDPLTGADAVTGPLSGIVGHTKVALRSIASTAGTDAKLMLSTGTCTVANYTDSRAGKLGEFHHSLAAVIVEVDGDVHHIRQLSWDQDGQCVVDLDMLYRPDGTVEKAPRPLALVMGDTHVGEVDPGVEEATFGAGGIVESLKPHNLVWHDLFDGYSVNPHVTSPFEKVRRFKGGRSDVLREVGNAVGYVVAMTPTDTQSVVVSSNHGEFLRRWMNSHDWRNDPENAEYYLELALAMVKDPAADPLELAFGWRSGVRVLRDNQSFILADVELAMHGHVGPNGSRGSAKNLRRTALKSIIGHSHSPTITEGCWQTGTSSKLRLGYNNGPSSWMHAHVLLHASGKRQMLFIHDKGWRG